MEVVKLLQHAHTYSLMIQAWPVTLPPWAPRRWTQFTMLQRTNSARPDRLLCTCAAVLALAACSSSSLAAQRSVRVGSGAELVAALADGHVGEALVATPFLPVRDADFAGYPSPIALQRNLTIRSAPELPDTATVFFQAEQKVGSLS